MGGCDGSAMVWPWSECVPSWVKGGHQAQEMERPSGRGMCPSSGGSEDSAPNAAR